MLTKVARKIFGSRNDREVKRIQPLVNEINKLEQEQNELFTPQGPTLQKEKKRRLIGRILETLKLVKAIVPIPL